MQTVWNNDDLRKKILEIRENEMKKEYIKKIYVKWTKNKNGVVELNTLPLGTTRTSNTVNITWSLYPRNAKIDDAPLVVTDNVYVDKLIHYDTLVNLSHIQAKKQDWYIENFNIHKYDAWDLRDFYDNVILFTTKVHNKRTNVLVDELNYRKGIINI